MANVRSINSISTEILPLGILWVESYMYWITIDWIHRLNFDVHFISCAGINISV